MNIFTAERSPRTVKSVKHDGVENFRVVELSFDGHIGDWASVLMKAVASPLLLTCISRCLPLFSPAISKSRES
jgi:hypothetical protein